MVGAAAGAFLHKIANLGGLFTSLGCILSFVWVSFAPVYEEVVALSWPNFGEKNFPFSVWLYFIYCNSERGLASSWRLRHFKELHWVASFSKLMTSIRGMHPIFLCNDLRFFNVVFPEILDPFDYKSKLARLSYLCLHESQLVYLFNLYMYLSIWLKANLSMCLSPYQSIVLSLCFSSRFVFVGGVSELI